MVCLCVCLWNKLILFSVIIDKQSLTICTYLIIFNISNEWIWPKTKLSILISLDFDFHLYKHLSFGHLICFVDCVHLFAWLHEWIEQQAHKGTPTNVKILCFDTQFGQSTRVWVNVTKIFLHTFNLYAFSFLHWEWRKMEFQNYINADTIF